MSSNSETREHLGGKDNFAIDREIGQKALQAHPETANSTDEVAQAVLPEARVVYVDNDPIVLAHARALLTSSPEGETAYLGVDLT